MKRLDGIVEGLEEVIRLPDPVWRSTDVDTAKRADCPEDDCTPGTIAIIYESRPNVTVDAFALAVKRHCILLRGSSSALHSNRALVRAVKQGLSGLHKPEVLELADSGSRDEVLSLLSMKGYIDLVIPRGGKDLIDFVVENSKIPVLKQVLETAMHLWMNPQIPAWHWT